VPRRVQAFMQWLGEVLHTQVDAVVSD